VSKLLGFNIAVSTDTSLSSQSLALVLTTKPEQPRDNTRTRQNTK